MKIKTSELTGPALDWAVAKCEGLPIRHDPMNFGPAFAEGGFWIWDERGPIGKREYRLIGRQYNPSTNWSQGGPIIERILGFELKCWLESKPENRCEAHIHNYEGNWVAFGPTPLIAAMRCFCCAKLGDVVDVPEELL